MKTKFRISQNDTITAKLFNKEDKPIAQLYDSGYTTINQVKGALLNKVNDYNKTNNFTLSIVNEDKQTYWSNR